MFTGIVAGRAVVRAVEASPAGRRLVVERGPLPGRPAVGASVAVQGVCLTVAGHAAGDALAFDVIPETLARTTLGGLAAGTRVNVEPALRVGDELSGHLVSGHVDGVGEVLAVDRGAGVVARFALPAGLARFVAPKGSIGVDGISLTVVEAGADWFTVALIPETLARTSAADWAPGVRVNLEVDLVARYVARLLGEGPGP